MMQHKVLKKLLPICGESWFTGGSMKHEPDTECKIIGNKKNVMCSTLMIVIIMK